MLMEKSMLWLERISLNIIGQFYVIKLKYMMFQLIHGLLEHRCQTFMEWVLKLLQNLRMFVRRSTSGFVSASPADYK